MCKHGTDVLVRVKVAAHLSSTGEEKWREFGIDACIAPIVKALQDGGIDMLASCCGHGKADGRIDLADGRVLTIHDGSGERNRPPASESLNYGVKCLDCGRWATACVCADDSPALPPISAVENCSVGDSPEGPAA